MRKSILTFYSAVLTASLSFAQYNLQNLNAEQALQKADKQFFIENKGQWHPDVLYLTRMGGLDVWITKYGVNYTFYKIEKNPNTKRAEHLPSKFDHELENATLLGHRVLFKLQNHNANPQPEGKHRLEGYYNYLIGNDPSKHATYVGLYKEAVVKNVYNGIDLRYYFDKGYLRYDFIVHPGADPSQIKFELEGEFNEYLKNDALCYTISFGEVQIQDLYAYQHSDKKQVQAKFTQQKDVWQFQVSAYDKTQPLIIDPLIYSTYIGGNQEEYSYSISIDGTGNAHITGYTYSTNYDITSGAFQTTKGAAADVFVTKLNSTGTGLICSTYIGGSDNESGHAIAIDGSGNAYITGYTGSTDYPITPGAFQTTKAGVTGVGDVFVIKLNSTGTGLLYSTYIGGNSGDIGESIAIDGSGNAYITGLTNSNNYPITPGAFQTTYGGGFKDVFVTKLNSTGTGLIYSTYIGGNEYEEGSGIAIDGSGNAYITGYTISTDYDITPGAFQTTKGVGEDVFITKLNSTGTGLIYSTYIGGSGSEQAYGITIDGSGNAYITGWTNSNDYDITPGAFQTIKGYWADVFVTKLNSTGTGLIYSTYIGGSEVEQAYGIAIDRTGNAYITGLTYSYDYKITPDAFQTTKYGPRTDVFVTKLNSTGTDLIYSSYIGGSDWDYGYAIAIDGPGNAYVTGATFSSDFDITPGAFQTTFSCIFVTKFKLGLITGIEKNLFNKESQFSIFPNPNKGSFTIQASKAGVFELMDITGKVISTYTITNTQQTFHENLPTGVYFIREKGSGAVQKLIVN